MTDDTHLDGNALGGMLLEVFGREMTEMRSCCDSCGDVHPIGAMRVYRGPGDVVRCPTCDSVVVVAATIHERTRVHLSRRALARGASGLTVRRQPRRKPSTSRSNTAGFSHIGLCPAPGMITSRAPGTAATICSPMRGLQTRSCWPQTTSVGAVMAGSL